ncbi:MAG: helix-hairpin-helix domain-containing protein, partial [Minisyncoccia bacterium]
MFLKKSGFHVNNEYLHTDTIADIQKFYESWVEKRHNQEYGIDGMVIKINNNAICKALGYTAKAPRFAVAYKFPAEQKTTRVLDIVTQIGRSGVLTPVAHLEPVLIDGSMVSRATLHNADEIARLDVRIGDTVIVEKAGDIIPKIKSVLKNMRDDYSAPFSLQDYFSKNNITAYAETSNAGVLSWYIDPDTSSEIAIMSLSYFCSKKALNIEGMGEKNVRALYDAGFIKNFSDIYSVSYDQVISLPLFKERATQNLLDAVEKSKKTRFAQLLTGIGIRHVGEEVADLYAKNITPDQFLHIDYETFVALHSIGEKIAQSTVDWADQEKNQIEFKKLLDIFTFAETENTSGVFAGKIFVVTG